MRHSQHAGGGMDRRCTEDFRRAIRMRIVTGSLRRVYILSQPQESIKSSGGERSKTLI